MLGGKVGGEEIVRGEEKEGEETSGEKSVEGIKW